MCFDTLALALAVGKLAKMWRAGGKSRLVQVLIRDQILWYILIEAVSVINLLVAYVSPGPSGGKGRGVIVSVVTSLTSISVSVDTSAQSLTNTQHVSDLHIRTCSRPSGLPHHSQYPTDRRRREKGHTAVN